MTAPPDGQPSLAVSSSAPPRPRPRFYYGWYIVGVGFLAQLTHAFSISSTLSIFLKPITTEFGISRGVFSVLRASEDVMYALMAPLLGPLIDRYGARGLMVVGAIIAGAGFVLLSQVSEFWQFFGVRLALVSVGANMMGHLVVNVAVSNWFIAKRGRAVAFSSLGQGVTKVAMPIVATLLLITLGWRYTWALFGIVMWALVVVPAYLLVRRRPEDLGLRPDGEAPGDPEETASARGEGGRPPGRKLSKAQLQALAADDAVWSPSEALRTSAFWLTIVTFGVASVGIHGLNLHLFPYITDRGYSTTVAATVMSVIAFNQMMGSLFWGFLAERIDIRLAAMLKFLVQALGLTIAVASSDVILLYGGFFIYGLGHGGSLVLYGLIWASFYGRRSLGMVRGLGQPMTMLLGAGGPIFFGFLFDATGSYASSLVVFIGALLASALLVLLIRPPQKATALRQAQDTAEGSA